MVSQDDITCFSDVKAGLPIELPGYVPYRSTVVGSTERGGTAVCVKNSLVNSLHSFDVSYGDQVWLRCKKLQGMLMGFCYIPPGN